MMPSSVTCKLVMFESPLLAANAFRDGPNPTTTSCTCVLTDATFAQLTVQKTGRLLLLLLHHKRFLQQWLACLGTLPAAAAVAAACRLKRHKQLNSTSALHKCRGVEGDIQLDNLTG